MTVGSLTNPGSSGSSQRKTKGAKVATAPAAMAPSGARYGEGAAAANGGLTLRDPVTGAQYVQIQLLQVGSSTSYCSATFFSSTLYIDLK